MPVKGNPLGIPKGGVRLALFDEQPFGYYSEGTSFPLNPQVGWRVFRTDIRGGMAFRWNGTYWLSEQSFSESGYADNISASPQMVRRVPLPSDLSVYLMLLRYVFYVVTTNTGVNYWTFTFEWQAAAGNTVIWTPNTSAYGPNVNVRPSANAINLLLDTATALQVEALVTKVGTPGNIYALVGFDYRLRAI